MLYQEVILRLRIDSRHRAIMCAQTPNRCARGNDVSNARFPTDLKYISVCATPNTMNYLVVVQRIQE